MQRRWLHFLVCCLRPSEGSPLKPLDAQPKPRTVEGEHLHPRSVPIAEHKQASRQQILPKVRFDQGTQSIEPEPQIRRPASQEHPRRSRQSPHRSARITCPTQLAGAPTPTLTITPLCGSKTSSGAWFATPAIDTSISLDAAGFGSRRLFPNHRVNVGSAIPSSTQNCFWVFPLARYSASTCARSSALRCRFRFPRPCSCIPPSYPADVHFATMSSV